MIDQLVSALGQELGLTSKEIADTIWLALQMESPELSSTAKKAMDGEADAKLNRDKSVNLEALNTEEPPQEGQPTAELHTPSSQFENGGGLGSELMLKIPDARSLREPLSLAKSLKPLLQKVTAGWSTKLDEAATVERIADEGIWMPVLQPALEPWLDLALVVDESISMHLWQRTLTELQRLLANYGVFRDVRVWSLVTDDEGQVKLRPRLGTARRQTPHRPSELIDASGRRLILIATDCVSAIWQDGTVLPALKLWADNGPMAILQMLPEWLWARTGLGFASAVRLHAMAPGVPNQRLDVRDLALWDEVDLEAGVRVPVVTLEPEPFLAWAKMASSQERAWSPGFIFEPDSVTSIDIGQLWNNTLLEDSAEQRIQQFRTTASPLARRLAGLLAAAPIISLPIVDILRERLLPQSRQTHVAEVFLGGILKPTSDLDPDINRNFIQYVFLDGLRDKFLESLPSIDTLNVLEEVSSYVADNIGLSTDTFLAVLKKSKNSDPQNSIEALQPFAAITASILRKLGGEYSYFASQLEFESATTESEESTAIDSQLPNSSASPSAKNLLGETNSGEDFEVYAPDFETTTLVQNQGDHEYYIYEHLRELRHNESIEKVIESFRQLFIQADGYDDYSVWDVVVDLSQRTQARREFKYFLNRCCYSLINPWLTQSDNFWAITNLIQLFEDIPTNQLASYETKRIRQLSQLFTQTEQYAALGCLANLVNEQRDVFESLDEQLLGTLIKRYPFLYDSSLLTKDSDQYQKSQVNKLRQEAEVKFGIKLARYHSQLSKEIVKFPNPTQLSDAELQDALIYYTGKVEGNRSHRDLAQMFRTYSKTVKSFRDFKEEFLEYLLSPLADADPRYVNNHFGRSLREYLRATLQDFDDQRLNDFIVITTCQKLLNFLIVQGRQRPVFRRYWLLLDEAGPALTTGLLLRVVLFCSAVKPWLENRMAVLFNYHSKIACKEIPWLINSLEHTNVALITNFGKFGYQFL